MMSDLSRLRGRWCVVKIGGELALDPPKLSRSVGNTARRLVDAGVKVAIVHGGGPQATELQRRLALETKQVAGQRITDAATLEVMKMALAGQASVDVASALRLAGVEALCTSGVSGGLIDATRRAPVEVKGQPEPVDYGLVGDVSNVNVALYEKLASAGIVLAVASLAGDGGGRVFNVNADTVAARLAGRLHAAHLLLVSNVPGVLSDRNDPSSRLRRLSTAEARAHIASGVIGGGMIPKVEESLTMLEEGIEAIHIVGVEPETSLLDELANPGSRGTVLTR